MYPVTAFNTNDNDDGTEREYDRLRDLARDEAEKRNACFDKVRPPFHHPSYPPPASRLQRQR